MKRILLFFIIMYSHLAYAQDRFPFQVGILEAQAAVDDSIRPVFKDEVLFFSQWTPGA